MFRGFFNELIAPLMTSSWARRLSWAALICMLLLLVTILIGTVITLHSDLALVATQQRIRAVPAANETAKLITSIPAEHIFGEYGVLDKDSFVPITSLQLRLLGVIQSIPEAYSRVIISEAGQPGKVYQVGDILPSGVKIYQILRDGVILQNGGRLEKLPLQRPPLLFQGLPKRLINDQNAQGE